MSEYLLLKFVHVLVAIVALGTSAGLGIMLEFYSNNPQHGSFVLRAIARIEAALVMPGYVVMLLTGLRLRALAWQPSPAWLDWALVLWGIGGVMFATSLVLLRKQIRAFEAGDQSSARYRRLATFQRLVGGGAGLTVVLIVYLMVAKPMR